MSPSYLLLVFIALFAGNALGDVYMHNPRGNNDRLMETTTDRGNAQRLFDSENNARGGYCWGPALTYYEGSILSVEWTNQHSCGNDNTKCEIVLQYMCADSEGDETLVVRDGTITGNNPTTITTVTNPTATDYYNVKDPITGEFEYGMNEPYWVYRTCQDRQRNLGLFTADIAVSNNQGAMATRQNAGGTRYGFECGEERAYYPYWHPTVWRDIAVFVDDKSECSYYQSQSQNVKGKNWCNGTTTAQKAANNEQSCLTANGQWLVTPPWGLDKPDCKEAAWSRDNHLGNGVDGFPNGYNWTLPRPKEESCIDNGNCTCVLRIRYNITVGEVQSTDDSRKNNANSPVTKDPTVAVEGNNFTLALDTAQTGRTFQDRSYMFHIAPRPSGVSSGATIYNLNVRGKRGNIVQNYPAVEYDFVPTFLAVDENDYVHVQWTGCDYNNANQQGEGKVQTDRSNIVQIADMSKNYPLNDTQLGNTKLLFKDDELRNRMAWIDQVNCLSAADLQSQAGTTAVDQNPQNCMILNAAGPRFSGALVKLTDPGTYYYMSTRNNNFSNRSQKASIKVKKTWPAYATALIVIGGVAVLGVGAAAGTVFYAKRHPLSKVAEFVQKVPGLNKV